MLDDLEFSIIQYLDGSLSEAERDALESRLGGDAEARVLLEEHRKLGALLKASATPELQWDALAGQISAAVADVEIPVEHAPARGMKMPWVRAGVSLALAASVLIAAGLALRLIRPGSSSGIGAAPQTSVAVITGPAVEMATGPSDMQVTVGPEQVASGESSLSRYSDDVISRPSHITVASGINAVQDINPPDLQ